MMRRLGLLSCAGLFAGACGVTHLDAGSSDHDGSDGGSARGVLWPDPPSNSLGFSCPLLPADFAAGAWKGTFDSYLPATGPNIEIHIDGGFQPAPGGYGLCGKVILGSGDPVPLPTDPEAPPPNAPSLSSPGRLDPVGGFPYEFQIQGLFPADPAVDGRRLQISINLTQVFKAWCNMQPSFQLDPDPDVQSFLDDPTRTIFAPTPNRFVCLPPHTLSNSVSGGVECEGLQGLHVHGRSCAQAVYCILGICSCGSVYTLDDVFHGNEGCTGGDPFSGNTFTRLRFDMTVTGSTMTGSLVLSDRVESLHLTR